MTVISHGPKEKCWNNTSHERFQASWSAMYIENPQPGITVQKDPSPPKKKTRKEKKMLQAGHDIPSFFLLTGSSSSFILLVPVIKMLRKRSPESANINVKKN